MSTWKRRPQGDEGMTMIDLVVGMGIMAIFMGMFTGAMLLMQGSQQKAESVSQTAAQLNQAFLSLDKSVRYAAAISTPGKGPSGDWYVELRHTTDGVETCSQLRVDSGKQQLRQRTWKVAGGGASNLSAWLPIASGISNGAVAAGSADQPFTLEAQADNVAYQKLQIKLVAKSGANSNMTTSRSAITFAALNSTIPLPSGPVCQEVVRQ